MRTLLILICLCLATVNAIQSQELPEIIPPSPEASSLGKFVEVPVSYYTGIPNISIPFYTITSGSIRVPVSISYHARGIQVEEQASRVGLGWSLNAGGVITRKTRGKADDALEGYLRGNFYDTFFSSEATRMAVYNDVINDQADLEPDAFSFNFSGFSGKFVFDQNTKQPVLQNFDDIKIEPLFEDGTFQSIIIGWIITDKYGLQYHFGISEDQLRTARDEEEILNQYTFSLNNGMFDNGSGPTTSHYNSWYLLDIITPQGKSVAFLYEKEYPEYHRRSSDSKIFDFIDDEINTEDVVANFSKVKSHQNQLKQILFDSGRIEFTASTTEREDLTGAYALESITIYNQNDEPINSFTFHHSYTTSPDNNNQPDYLKIAEPQASKRLFLESIEEHGRGIGANSKRYTFDYNDQLLPNRFSTSQDNWGYYNGKNNGRFLTFFGYSGFSIDRSVDTVKSAAGMLKKITYPTGGHTSLEFEHNKGTPPVGVDNMFYSTNNPVVEKWDGMLKDPQYFIGGNYEKTIVIGENKVGNVRSVIQFNNSTGCSTTQNMVSCHYQVELLGENSYSLFMGDHENLTIEPGEYILRVIPNGFEDPEDFENGFAISLQWEEQAISDEEFFYAAGKRIKTIVFDDGQGNVTQKNYQYTNEDGTTSGKLFGLPNFHWIQDEIAPGVFTIDKYGSKPGSPLTALQGNSIGYARVTEFLGDTISNLGKIEYTFTTYEDSGEYYQFPYHLPTDNEWLRGAPLTTRYYKREDSDYIIQKQLDNTYVYNATDLNPLTLMYPLLPPDGLHSYINNSTQFSLPLIIFSLNLQDPTATDHNDYKVFHLNGGTAHSRQVTETVYEEGLPVLTNTTQYNYNYNTNYQVAETETTNALGEIDKTKTYYPGDVNALVGLQADEIAAINQLNAANQHRIAEAIQTETYEIDDLGNEQLVSTLRTLYTDWGGGMILPGKIAASKDQEPLENRISYEDYDNFGNPLEVSKEDGTPISYIWGYQNTRPVAKLDGISYIDIDPATITSLQFLSDNDIDAASEQSLRDALSTLRSDHPEAQVTTFTYDPLIGVTSVTDPKDYTSFYVYDQFNRLESIKDEDRNVISTFNYNYAQEAVVYDPLNAGINYGTDDTDHQWFSANMSGGSGDYSYAWFEGVGDSSTDFEANASGTDTTYQLMVDCSTTKYVKLVVTDNITGEMMEQTKVNNNSCNYPPLNVSINYGLNSDTFQGFNSNVSGGSGDYSYAWHKGVGTSSFTYEVAVASALPVFKLFVDCSTSRWVKLVITDNVTGEVVYDTKQSNNGPCAGGGGGGGPEQ